MTDELDEKFVEDISDFAGDAAVAIYHLIYPIKDPRILTREQWEAQLKNEFKALVERFFELIQIYD